MKKICFEIEDGIYPVKVGGMEIFNYYFIEELSKYANVSYVAYSKYNHEAGKHIHSYKIRPTKYLTPFQLGMHLLSCRPDTVVISYSEAHHSMWNLYNRVLSFLKLPYVIIIHHGKVPGKDHYHIYRRFFNQAKAVVSVSEDIKKNYDELYGINCITIPPLVPFKYSESSKAELREKYTLPQDATIIGMVGSVKGMKNPDTILRAIAEMTEEQLRQYNPHVVLAGSGAHVEVISNLGKELGISERVHMLGFIPKEKVCDIMNLIDYYLIASDYEGTSVSLLEAMFNKKPILASYVIGIKDTITDKDCKFFEVKNHMQLRERLLELFQNPILGKEISNNAYQTYKAKYDYSNVIRDYLEIL